MNWVITGASGLLGSHIRALISPADSAVYCYLNKPVNDGIRLDLTDRSAVFELFTRSQFDACIHTAALANVAECENNPALAKSSNVEATRNIADACQQFNVKLVHVSTDYVFDGTSNTPYTEDSPPNPRQVYGQTKLEAEQVCATLENAIVARIPLLYGRFDESSKITFLENCLSRLRSNTPIDADSEQVRQPAATIDVARLLIQLASSDTVGIVHIAPNETLTKYEFALVIAKAAGLDTDLVASIVEKASIARPVKATLTTNKLEALGFKPPRNASQAIFDFV